MEILHHLLDFILHLDTHLEALMSQYQLASYGILCLIIFCETGLVVTPFLPGDSLLFAAGAIIAKTGILNVWLLIPLLMAAAILGDNVNYFFGNWLGERVFSRDYWFLKRNYLEQTQAYYEKHGGKTLVMARFLPIVRTFAPFVAGVGTMKYQRFIGFCILGCVLWVPTLTLAGYFFGQLPFVKNNFELVIFALILIPGLPALFTVLKNIFSKKNS